MLPELESKVKNGSVTEEYAPKYRKYLSRREPVQIQIQKSHCQIGNIINELDAIFAKRMDTHEQELLQIMKMETLRMIEDVKKIVKVYNSMIKEKNLSQDLLQTRNQADYFKYEAVRLFQQNNYLKKEIRQLRSIIDSEKMKSNEHVQALKKMAKKLYKVKTLRSDSQKKPILHCGIKKELRLHTEISLDEKTVKKENMEEILAKKESSEKTLLLPTAKEKWKLKKMFKSNNKSQLIPKEKSCKL